MEQEQETGATVFRLTERLKITETLRLFEFDFEIECSIQILKSKSNLLSSSQYFVFFVFSYFRIFVFSYFRFFVFSYFRIFVFSYFIFFLQFSPLPSNFHEATTVCHNLSTLQNLTSHPAAIPDTLGSDNANALLR